MTVDNLVLFKSIINTKPSMLILSAWSQSHILKFLNLRINYWMNMLKEIWTIQSTSNGPTLDSMKLFIAQIEMNSSGEENWQNRSTTLWCINVVFFLLSSDWRKLLSFFTCLFVYLHILLSFYAKSTSWKASISCLAKKS